MDDVWVTYRVYEDPVLALRQRISRLGRRRAMVPVEALKGVSFAAHQGEIIGVIGPNGSGKTSLMQAIAGSLPVSRGAIYASSEPTLLGVGAVLNRRLSGRRNVIIGLLALGLSRHDAHERLPEIIEFAGLQDAIDRPLRTYSTGMRARLQFAIATSVRPKILLVDEALVVGDNSFKRRSQARIRELQEFSSTVFIVSHNLSEIRSNCSRALWLHQGVLADDGDPANIVRKYRSWSREFD